MREGSERRVRGRVHPDRRVQAVVEQAREAEMVQAIDRLRLIHSPRERPSLSSATFRWRFRSMSW
jgi:hypothetical protein